MAAGVRAAVSAAAESVTAFGLYAEAQPSASQPLVPLVRVVFERRRRRPSGGASRVAAFSRAARRQGVVVVPAAEREKGDDAVARVAFVAFVAFVAASGA